MKSSVTVSVCRTVGTPTVVTVHTDTNVSPLVRTWHAYRSLASVCHPTSRLTGVARAESGMTTPQHQIDIVDLVSRHSHSNDEQPLIKSNVVAAIALSANAILAAYFVFQAWSGPEEWRVEAIAAATGLALLAGTVAWSRFGKRS